MNYKKYVFGIIGLFCLPMFVIWTLAWILPEEYYMDIEYPYWMQQKDHISSFGDQQEILMLGDSKVKTGIIVTEMGNNVYNLALGGATSIEMYYTLKTYLKNHPKPKLVIIAFSPMHYFEIDGYCQRNLYFRYFDEDIANEVDKIMIDRDNTSKKSEKYFHRLPNVYMDAIIKHLFNPRTEENRAEYKKISDTRGWIRLEDKKQGHVFGKPKVDDFKVLPSIDYYMNLMLSLCKKEEIPTYIEQVPMADIEYKPLFASGYLDSYREYMHSFAKRYDIPVEEVVPVFEDIYFYDDVHLNAKGAEILTEQWKNKYKNFIND